MTNKNVILKDGDDYIFPKTKTSIVVNDDDETLETLLTSKADLVEGKIPSSQLPSYVDDVVELVTISDAEQPSSLYTTGDKYLNSIQKSIYTVDEDGNWDDGVAPESGVIYVALDTNKTYRWTGSTIVEIASTDISSKQDQINTVGLLKGSGNGIISTASAGVDYAVADHEHTVSEISDLTASADELNYTQGVTSAIQTQLDEKAPVDSPDLTGVPTAPTAASGTNTTQIATTEFVQNAISGLSSISYESI